MVLVQPLKSASRRDDEHKRMQATAEILGLLEEKNRNKDWVIAEIKRHKLKLPIKHTENPFEILKACPSGFIFHLLRVLKHDDFEPSDEIPLLVKNFHWFYTDLVASSDPTILIKDQARMVWALYQLIGRTETYKNMNPKLDVMNITGDGMIIGFHDAPEKPLRLATELHKLLNKYNQLKKQKKIKIRVGINTGSVYIMKDPTGRENFWGPGIIIARRLMDLARPMQILTSDKIANDIGRLNPQNKSALHYIGEYKIKHGEKLKIYNIYGDGFGNRRSPPNAVTPVKEDDPNTSKFLFPKIEVRLDVTDPKTWLCHHTWIWRVINVTDKPNDQIGCYLEGDSPRDFSDLNLTIRDEDNKKIKIAALNVNRPDYKEFTAKLNKSIKPNKKGILKLEYDWEEPERNFVYTLATDCKKFEYFFTIPKGVEIKPRVLKVDPVLKTRALASAPEVKYGKNQTEIRWQASNLRAFSSYRFEW